MGSECCNDLKKTTDTFKLKEELKKGIPTEKESSIVISKTILEYDNISVLIIINENENNVEDLIDKFDTHFFGLNREEFENKIKYSDNNISYTITHTSFKNIQNYSNNNYNLIISFSENLNEINDIINTFNDSKFIFKKIIEKKELLQKYKNIKSNDIILTNNIENQIINYFLKCSNKQLINENKITSSTNSLDLIKQYFICPLSKSIMVEPVITPSGHHYERKFIENEIKKRGKSPSTNNPLKLSDLTYDKDMKRMIKNLFYNNNTEV